MDGQLVRADDLQPGHRVFIVRGLFALAGGAKLIQPHDFAAINPVAAGADLGVGDPANGIRHIRRHQLTPLAAVGHKAGIIGKMDAGPQQEAPCFAVGGQLRHGGGQ